MNPEYMITREHIKEINAMYGGSLRTDAEIETALLMGKGKNMYRKIAILWRAILVGHPFTDGNKRTALMVALTILEKCDMGLDDAGIDMVVEEITKIARENITDLNRIERLVRYVATGN